MGKTFRQRVFTSTWALLWVGTCALLAFLSVGAWAREKAPIGQPWPATWSSGNKQFFGSAFEARDSQDAYSAQSSTAPLSRLWFTGAQGVITEIYWPTLDRKQIRDWQFLISDGKSFFVEERVSTRSSVEWVEDGVPAFRVSTISHDHSFELVKLYYVDPDSDTLICELKVVNSSEQDLQVYSLVNPTLANTPYGDKAEVKDDFLLASQGGDWLAHHSYPSFVKKGVGHSGTMDPFQDLRDNFRYDQPYRYTDEGNVVLMGQLETVGPRSTREFLLTVSFGDSEARARAKSLTSTQFHEEKRQRFVSQWREFQRSIDMPELRHDHEELYRSSAAILRSMEDRTFAGAFIASPSVPWGLQKLDDSSEYSPRHTEFTGFFPEEAKQAKGIGAYHLVWPRDLFQMARSFLALGDKASARAALRYLKQLQFGPEDGAWEYGARRYPKDGSFVQNAWMHGEAYWHMLQIDQVSFPVVLAYDLWKAEAIQLSEFRSMVLRAADFLFHHGPWSYQERWEENKGVSPSGLAIQILALKRASELAIALGDEGRARNYERKATELDANIERWTFTQSGPKGDGQYYLRVVGTSTNTAEWDPNSLARIRITNGGEIFLEKEVVDGGFLELVRYGVRKAWDHFVVNTLPEYDADLRKELPTGSAFVRYTGDRYNWNEFSGAQTNGQAWPFLTGERASYELERAKESGNPERHYNDRVKPLVEAFRSFASKSYLFPEQIWYEGAFQGQGTGAATPLGWAHGEYIQLLQQVKSFESGTVQN